MNGVRALGYLAMTSDRLDEWRHLAGDLLGGHVVERDATGFDVRLDRRAWRLRFTAGDANDLDFAGWEVADDSELDSLRAHLEGLGHAFEEASPRDAAARQVSRVLAGADPDGNRVELFHSAAITPAPFVSPRQVEFRTGLGVGHLVLHCTDLPAMLDFYCGGLGLRVTDTMVLSDEVVYFLRCNERHHSLALVAGRDRFAVQHIMLEVADVDAVGAAFERCSEAGRAQATLGRHSNDEMLSFYALAPGGYTVEYGFGGRLIEERTHEGAIYTSTSWWGHRDLQASR